MVDYSQVKICPHCGVLVSERNWAQHIRRKRCKEQHKREK